MAAYQAAWLRKIEREDRQHAMIAWLFANANRDTKKRPELFTLEDFMPHTPRKPQEAAQIAAQQRVLAEVFRAEAAASHGEFTEGSEATDG